MTAADTAKVLDRLFAALAAGDDASLRDVFAPEVAWQQPASVPDWSCHGVDDVVERLGKGVVRDLFQPGTFRLTVHRTMIDGNVAITQQSTEAVTTRGEPYAMEYCWIYTCEAHRIVHIREYLDTYLASKAFRWDDPSPD